MKGSGVRSVRTPNEPDGALLRNHARHHGGRRMVVGPESIEQKEKVGHEQEEKVVRVFPL